MQAITDLLQTESIGICAETLDFWLYECAIDEAPDIPTVCVWQASLASRGGAFTRLADVCQTWLDEEAAK